MEDTTRVSEDQDAKKSERLTESAPQKSYPVTPETKKKLEEMVTRFVKHKPKPKSEFA